MEVTLDSGAGASCWPEECADGPEVQSRGAKFWTANGAELKYHGTNNIKCAPLAGIKKHGLRDQVSCGRNDEAIGGGEGFARMGDHIFLEGVEGRSYIECIASGDKAMLRESGGAYMLGIACAKDVDTGFSRRGSRSASWVEGRLVRLKFGANTAERRSRCRTA